MASASEVSDTGLAELSAADVPVAADCAGLVAAFAADGEEDGVGEGAAGRGAGSLGDTSRTGAGVIDGWASGARVRCGSGAGAGVGVGVAIGRGRIGTPSRTSTGPCGAGVGVGVGSGNEKLPGELCAERGALIAMAAAQAINIDRVPRREPAANEAEDKRTWGEGVRMVAF